MVIKGSELATDETVEGPAAGAGSAGGVTKALKTLFVSAIISATDEAPVPPRSATPLLESGDAGEAGEVEVLA